MERKVIDDCVVFFDRDVTFEELRKLFSPGFDGDIVINGSLIDDGSVPTDMPITEVSIYGNLWILGNYKPNTWRNINRLIINGSLYSKSNINIDGDLEVCGDLVLYENICSGNIFVGENFNAYGYINAGDIFVVRNFVTQKEIDSCQVIVTQNWSCYNRANTCQVTVGQKFECYGGINTNGYSILAGQSEINY